MEYKSNQHRQMATVKNILSQIFFPKRQELSSHEPYSGSCGTRAQWNLNPENEELRITGTGPLFDFFGEKEVPWESHLDHIRKVVAAHGITPKFKRIMRRSESPGGNTGTVIYSCSSTDSKKCPNCSVVEKSDGNVECFCSEGQRKYCELTETSV